MPDALPRPEPFTPRTDPAALEDLRARLRAMRWPDAPHDAGWSLGTDAASASTTSTPGPPRPPDPSCR